jgi:DNA-binding response OmpR family regulator
MKELEARIRAVHRRGKPAPEQALAIGDLRYEPGTMLATRQGKPIALTRTQAVLLRLLMQHSPHVVTHQKLMEDVWGEEGGDIAALHTHVYALRGLIDRPFDAPLIHSVHGLGYRLGPG